MAAVARKRQPPVQSEPRGRYRAPMYGDTGWPLIIQLRPVINLSDDQFLAFCSINGDLQFERSAEGELLIMTPAGWETGVRNADLVAQFVTWSKHDGTGTVTDSSGGFRLPNSAIRGPDVAWTRKSRSARASSEQRAKFLPMSPDFALELRSPSDTLTDLQEKMEEYIKNGVRLGWLLDPKPKHVYIYRPNAPVERLENPESLSGDPVLPGFVLDLREIW